jgi:hypothetical protein
MTRVSPQAGSDKWKTRLSAATQDITNGVNNVTQAPGLAAAAKRDKWLQGVNAAADKWKRNVAAVSLQQWQQMMTSVGVPRIAQGAQAKQSKYTDFASQFYPFLDQQVAKIKAMPDTQLEDRIQRAVAMMRANATFQRSPSA